MSVIRVMFKGIAALAVAGVLCVVLFPFYIVLVMGTWQNDELLRTLPYFFGDFFLGNVKIIMHSNFLRSYFNSIVVSLSAVILCTFSASLIGFALAKYEFRLRRYIFGFIIAIMMVPQQIAIVGYIIEMRVFGLQNTLFPIIVIWLANPFSAFFMVQYMKSSVPLEIVESARIDGCSEPRIYASIVVPFIKPAIATISILIFLWSWNNYMLPLIAISRGELYTVPLFITTLGTEYRDDYGARMCALSFAIFPIMIVYLISSKNFIKGITAGALKG